MNIKKTVSVSLSPDEVGDIIRKHLKDSQNIIITDVGFNISTKYTDSMDQHGHDYVKSITCDGTISDEDK